MNKQTNKHNALYCTIKVALQKWMVLMFLWAREYPVTDAADDAEVTRRVVIDMYGWFHDVCTNQLLASPIILGGPGVVVQIDESLFRHKPKVGFMVKNITIPIIIILIQHHRGRATTNEVWVFGLADTSHMPARGYMEIVSQRDAATLLPIIQAHVAPGTVIHSDQWAAYNRIHTLPNVASHSTVNHSITLILWTP